LETIFEETSGMAAIMKHPHNNHCGPGRAHAASLLSEGADQVNVGERIRQLRRDGGLSIRTLAELSALNVNTLSLIENNKASPSVSTLQQIAVALQVPIAAFFERKSPKRNLVFQKAGQRPRADFSYGMLEDLGAGLTLRGGQPLLVALQPGADSGQTPIVHTGFEFVYCLEGALSYIIEEKAYLLMPGDSLIFEAHLPHRWGNTGLTATRSLLILCPSDENDHPTERHFVTDKVLL
jgi:transcriptional regulator with XRE-family HTH domain